MISHVTGTYADVYAWSNLYLAYRKAAAGKRGHPPAAAFEFHLDHAARPAQTQPPVTAAILAREPKTFLTLRR